MASTYSPSLRLELMATGDQSGTWGDTTNTNLGTLLEQSITGYLSKAMADTDQTLTSLNGASDEARNMVVEATGALTAGRNIVVPTAEKVYLIKNSTTGGFAVTAKTTAGTGVAVPMDGAVWVYCDGTNVVSGNSYTVGLTSGAVFTDAGATVGPIYDLFRDSSSPAANDILGRLVFNGRDSAGNKQEYGSIEAVIADPTSTSEDGALDFYATIAGTRTRQLSVGPNNPNTPTQMIEGYATTATAAGTTTLTVASAKNQYFTGTTTQTVVLPVTSTLVLGQQFRIINNSTGKVTVQSSGANTIQIMGGTGITFAPGAPGTELILTCISLSGTGVASWAYKYESPTTDWVAYTPTFTSFGTATSISMWSRRVGDTLQVRGFFTTGTCTAAQARVGIGFNGTDGNVTGDATKVAGVQGGGTVTQGAVSGTTIVPLINNTVVYLTFGAQSAAAAGLTPVNANAVFADATKYSVFAEVPITNW